MLNDSVWCGVVWCGMVCASWLCAFLYFVLLVRFSCHVSMRCELMIQMNIEHSCQFTNLWLRMDFRYTSTEHTFNLNSIQIVRWSIQFTFEEKSNIFIKWIAPNSNSAFTCEIKLAVFLLFLWTNTEHWFKRSSKWNELQGNTEWKKSTSF